MHDRIGRGADDHMVTQPGQKSSD